MCTLTAPGEAAGLLWDRESCSHPRGEPCDGESSPGVRERIASTLEVSSSEIALTRSTTEGVNIALYGLDWKRGDEIISRPWSDLP